MPPCSHLRFPAVSLSPLMTHILPAFSLCPLASPWPPVIPGNWSSPQTCDHCCGLVPAPGSYWSLTGCSRTHRIGRLAVCPPPPPPPPPVVSLNRPILSPQNAGATLTSELPRCPDMRFGRCPNVAMGGWGMNCYYGDNQKRRADRPSGTGTLSPPFCLSPIIQTLSVKDTHTDGAERLGSKLSRLSADKNMHPPALPCLLLS